MDVDGTPTFSGTFPIDMPLNGFVTATATQFVRGQPTFTSEFSTLPCNSGAPLLAPTPTVDNESTPTAVGTGIEPTPTVADDSTPKAVGTEIDYQFESQASEVVDHVLAAYTVDQAETSVTRRQEWPNADDVSQSTDLVWAIDGVDSDF